MKDLKNKIIEKGYKVVSESETAVALVNEKVSYCAIIINDYSEDCKKEAFSLQNLLDEKYAFAKKSTILVIKNIPDDRHIIESGVYSFLKIFPDNLEAIPLKVDKDIVVTFSSMRNILDVGDFTVNPFEEVDGIIAAKFLIFLNSLETNATIKYPKIYENHFLRYVASKFFTVINE